MLQVKIDQIREGGLKLDEPVALALIQSTLAEAQGVGFRAERPFQLRAQLNKVGSGVLLVGGFTAELTAPCKRCLAEVRLTLPQEFTLNLIPRSLAQDVGLPAEAEDDGRSERGGSFELDDAEQEVYDGKVIDLAPIVREQLLLALPMSSVCGEGCAGLCIICGQNLNERDCGCERKPLDPRLAALKEIKIN
jgi:uncharacterized protein